MKKKLLFLLAVLFLSRKCACRKDQSDKLKPTKTYLKDFLQNFSLNQTKIVKEPEITIGICNVEHIGMSLKIIDCGRVLFNTTSCSGFCKSSSVYVTNSKMVKQTCSGCKVTEFEYVSYKVKCTDGSIKSFEIKAVKKCSCFKIMDKIYKN